jgi:hypothetical protein
LFAIAAMLRPVIVVPAGQLSIRAVLLSAEVIPEESCVTSVDPDEDGGLSGDARRDAAYAPRVRCPSVYVFSIGPCNVLRRMP